MGRSWTICHICVICALYTRYGAHMTYWWLTESWKLFIWIQRPKKWYIAAHYKYKWSQILRISSWRRLPPNYPFFAYLGVGLAKTTIKSFRHIGYYCLTYENVRLDVGKFLVGPQHIVNNIHGTRGSWLSQNMLWWKPFLRKVNAKSAIT